ncbi:MAG: signal peptidase I [Candidatus Bathyarchaeia archaeon]|nr:signal peptidase I [Candidatus Bathyarchaeota archaeon]
MSKPRIPPILISIILIILALALAYGVYASLVYAFKTRHPIGYVVGTSMLPTLQPGDLVIIVGVEAEDIVVGDIIVFQPPYRSEPIIHRVIAVEKIGGNIYITTKGDNNRVSLPDEIRFPVSYVIGKVVYRVPYIGWMLYFIQAPVVAIPGIGEVKLGFILIILLSLVYIIQDIVAHRKTERSKEAEDVCENAGLQI